MLAFYSCNHFGKTETKLGPWQPFEIGFSHLEEKAQYLEKEVPLADRANHNLKHPAIQLICTRF